MFSLNGTLKKKWVSRAMGNETIYIVLGWLYAFTNKMGTS